MLSMAIAETGIRSCYPIRGIRQGLSTQFSVTIFNYGNSTETFTVTVYANTTEIETREIQPSPSLGTLLALLRATTP